jgi:hypothetical protein
LGCLSEIPTSTSTCHEQNRQQKNEILQQARVNALEDEKASNSSQSMTSDSTERTPAEDTTLTSESVRTICERMSQLERTQAKSERKILLMFERLLNKGSPAAVVPEDSTPETPNELATVANGLVVLQELKQQTPKKRQKRNDQPSPATTTIDPKTPQYKAMEMDEGDKC